MAFNQQLSVFGQVAPATTGTAGQVLVSAGSSASSYWASAIPVSAYSGQFSGSQSLTLPGSTALTFGTGDFTIEFWFRTTATLQYTSFISNESSGGTVGYTLLLNTVTNDGKFVLYDTGSPLFTTSTGGYNDNNWHHFALVRIGTAFVMYVDGVSRASATSSASVGGGTNTIYIGASSIAGRGYNGFISNWRMVKGVGVYTGAFTVPTSPLGTAQAAGTNIAAVSASQTSLLTCNGPGFTDSSPNAAVITNNGTVIASQFAPFSSFYAISRSATQTQTILTSGSGTYYTPSGVAWLRIRMVGGGGGGAGAGYTGNLGSSGTSGTNTTFGTSLLNAGGGIGGIQTGSPGTGGTSSIGSGATGVALKGGGAGGCDTTSTQYSNLTGGVGGASAFGGAGIGRISAAGEAAATNTGGGGGGGGTNTLANGTQAYPGGGGGSGGYVEAYISSPAASYAYTVGAAGAGGASSYGYAGGGGGSGVIIVEENYAVNVSNYNYTASYLIVAGAGGGGGDLAGGGGAGGLLSGTATLTSGTTYTITVGAGGAGATGANQGTSGSTSVFSTVTAIGGGGGGKANGGAGSTGASGGSGGGNGWNNTATSGGSGTSGQGFAGGTTGSTNPGSAAGGGGSSAVGANGKSGSTGAGGAGTSSSITGSAVTYAGGGGGGGYNVAGAVGGAGGGGTGGQANDPGTVISTPTAGSTNLGGGGGGGGAYSQNGGAGGSGVVILSVPSQNYSGITTGSPTVTTSGSSTIIKFTASGSYTA